MTGEGETPDEPKVDKPTGRRRRGWWRWLLGALVVLVVGAGGWGAWRIVMRPAPKLVPLPTLAPHRSPAVSVTPSPSATPVSTAGWTPYTNYGDRYGLRYPASWQKRTCAVEGHTALYLAPTTAALGVCQSGNAGQMYSIVATGDQHSSYEIGAGYSDLTTQPVTVGSVSGERQAGTVATAGAVGPAVGTHTVQYIFVNAGRTYLFYYSQAPSGPTATDVLAEFDAMVGSTLTFTP
ncbi:MAG TPA: hypothetical protein VLI05_00500 [Candidatus Saccharimonadia bacterium]|nr:hypothetical protein [Candidatus Saccharimonadia bacterium]